jgi:hypothetical protein
MCRNDMANIERKTMRGSRAEISRVRVYFAKFGGDYGCRFPRNKESTAIRDIFCDICNSSGLRGGAKANEREALGGHVGGVTANAGGREWHS